MNGNSPLRTVFIGFGLAVVLTIIPFLTVMFRLGSRETIFAVIAGTATLQVLVHLRFFLGLRLRKAAPENLYPLIFATVLLGIMVAGTFWIMANASFRMGH